MLEDDEESLTSKANALHAKGAAMFPRPCGRLPLQQFDEFLLDQATAEATAVVRSHLEECDVCRAFLNGKSAADVPLLDTVFQSTRLEVSAEQDIEPSGSSAPNILEPSDPDFSFSCVGDTEQRSMLPLPGELDILDPPKKEGALGSLLKYDILGVRGVGGMGIVLQGYDRQLHRVVAIKLMSKRLTPSEKSLRRFEREAILAASISHPNVVTILSVESHRGLPFIVMEYVEGESLQQRLTNRGRLPVADAVRMTAQIASGLAAAHARGVIHRDIKPGNIMLENGIERVKITDFGLARVALDNSDLTSLGEAIGTPSYMSPEQIDGHELSTATDIFSLGCVVYAMFTTKSPFSGGRAIKVAQRITNASPPPLNEIDPEIPREFVQLVGRMLEKNPKDRTLTAAEIVSQLNSLLMTLNQATSGSLPVTSSTSPSRPYAKRLLIGGVLLAGLVIAGIYSQYQGLVKKSAEIEAASVNPARETELVPSIPARPVNFVSEREIAESLLNLGGSLVVSFPMGELKVWNSSQLPDDDFVVTEVDLQGNHNLTAADIAGIANLSRVKRLQFHDSSISNDDLKHIAEMTQLRYLGLGETEVTDPGLIHLERLTQLERLNLQATQVSSVGIKHLVGLKSINSLYLNDTLVDDLGLAELTALTGLRRLELCRTKISETSLSSILEMKGLIDLQIAETSLAGSILEKLEGLPELQTLNLKGLTISKEAIAHLRMALPNCEIIHE